MIYQDLAKPNQKMNTETRALETQQVHLQFELVFYEGKSQIHRQFLPGVLRIGSRICLNIGTENPDG